MLHVWLTRLGEYVVFKTLLDMKHLNLPLSDHQDAWISLECLHLKLAHTPDWSPANELQQAVPMT